MLKRFALVMFFLLATILSGCSSPKEEASLKIGSMPRVFDLIAYVAQQENLFNQRGVKVEIVPFRSTVEMNTALLTGALDGIIQDTFEAVNLNKERTVAKLVGCSVMPRMFEIVVPPGSGITTAAGLSGKQVATGTSTIMDYALERLLQANSINPTDITKVNIPAIPLRVEALNQRKVDAAILTPPLSDTVLASGGRVIIDDRANPFAGPGLVFSTKALDEKPQSVGHFVQAWQQAVDLINANPAKYQSMLNTVASVPTSVSLAVPTFPKLQLPDKAEFDSIVRWFSGQGLLTRQLSYEEIVSTKYVPK